MLIKPALLGPWSATAMVVSQVVGVGIFLTPATMMRTLGSTWAALAMWGVMGTLSAAGALGALVVALGIPVSSFVVSRWPHPQP